jgi:glycosyltransferase involved in cell wall biosynthesis
MDPVKGLGDLVAAMREIGARTTAHLLLVGDGPARRSTEALVRRDGLTARVHFLGERSDVPSCLRAADLFVFPSYTEGLPNALLEAMAAGLAVVTTDIPGCRDLITHEREGLLVPSGSPSAFAAAITRLLEDPALGQRLGQAARAKVQQGYGLAACCARWAGLYAACLRTRTEI